MFPRVAVLLSIVLLVSIAAIAVLVVPHVQIGPRAEDMRQGNLIVEELQAHDKTINAFHDYSYGGPVITIYAVNEEDRQNAILAQIRDMKSRDQINRKVEVRFYERENIIYSLSGKHGSSVGAKRGPEKLIRVAQL